MIPASFTHIADYRGGLIENTHVVHAAVVDSQGRLLLSIGDDTRITLLRSAIKPAQALAILESGAFDRYPFNDEDLALINASHSSEALHAAQTQRMLDIVGVSAADFRCGGHPALSNTVNDAWIRQNLTPGGFHNNCSGKHVGMMAGAIALGQPHNNYHETSHPMQQSVRAVVESFATPVSWAVDGCNLPTPAFPLRSIASMYAAFASADSSTPRSAHMARIFNSMCTYPELVAGADRFDTRLMRIGGGRLIGKVGADACFGIGVKESDRTLALGAVGSVGIAVKIEDGNETALYSTLVEILRSLDLITSRDRDQLDDYHRPTRINSMGAVIGVTKPVRLPADK